MALSEHKTTVKNQTIHYYEDGLHHGRSVLLLHGGIGDAKHNWADVIVSLAEDYHVLAPDLPSYGDSDSLPTNCSLSDMIDWVLGFLESQGIEQTAVVGSGLGALIARLMAAQHPNIVPAVILVNGGFIPDIPPLAKTLMSLPLLGNFFTGYLARAATSDESMQDLIHHAEAITPELKSNVQANLTGYAKLMRLTATSAPSKKQKPLVATLIIWGLADKSVSASAGQKLKKALAGATYIDIEGCGHLPHLEEPDIFDWQVKQFLAKNDPLKRNTIPGE